MSDSNTVLAWLDADDRLLSDDPRLAALNRRIGGDMVARQPLDLPAITGVARAARRLGRMVTRPVALATADADIAIWVRAQPQGQAVRLSLFDWIEEATGARAEGTRSVPDTPKDPVAPNDPATPDAPAGRLAAVTPIPPVVDAPPPADQPDAAQHIPAPATTAATAPPATLASASPAPRAAAPPSPVPPSTSTPSHHHLWTWRVDIGLRLLDVAGPAPLPPYGGTLTQWVMLESDAEGAMPLLLGLAARAAFTGQPARIAGIDAPLLLSGAPIFVDGDFTGFDGHLASPDAIMPVSRPDPAPAPAPAPAPEQPPAPQPQAQPQPILEPSPQPIANPIPDPVAIAPRGTPLPGASLDNALRRPLGRIIANADTISGQLEGPLRRDYATYAADIAVAGRHLMALVDDLADLRAIERPAFAVARESVDLADAARRAGGLLAVKAADKGITLGLPAADESLPATAEFRRVLQILVNLIGNAVRYSPDRSQVWVRCMSEPDRAIVTVADQGHGIAAEDQARIFEKFERLGRRDGGGSGLGLYISRRLARAMGGDIMIDSALGQGARFTLSLPSWPNETAAKK